MENYDEVSVVPVRPSRIVWVWNGLYAGLLLVILLGLANASTFVVQASHEGGWGYGPVDAY